MGRRRLGGFWRTFFRLSCDLSATEAALCGVDGSAGLHASLPTTQRCTDIDEAGLMAVQDKAHPRAQALPAPAGEQ
jgi:hypothetical protein